MAFLSQNKKGISSCETVENIKLYYLLKFFEVVYNVQLLYKQYIVLIFSTTK